MDFSLERLKKIVSSFRGAEMGALGIDIGSSSIKVVQLSRKAGRIVLDTYGALALGPYAGIEIGRATALPAQKLSEVLADLFREASVTSKECGVSIPLASSLVTTIEMPPIAEKDLATMVPIEARKYIPVSISEVSLDWWVVPKSEDPGSQIARSGEETKQMLDVLLVVILNDVLQRYQDVMVRSQVQSSFYEVEIFSTIRSVLPDGGMKPAMIVDFGAATTKIYMIEHGVVRSSHTINKGAQDITFAIANAYGVSVAEAENFKRSEGLAGTYGSRSVRDVADTVLRYVFTEANLSLLNFEKRFGKNIEQVYLTGGGSTLKGILEVAQTVFETSLVLGDPFSKVQTPAFMEPVLQQVGPEFAVALGVALRKMGEIDGV